MTKGVDIYLFEENPLLSGSGELTEEGGRHLFELINNTYQSVVKSPKSKPLKARKLTEVLINDPSLGQLFARSSTVDTVGLDGLLLKSLSIIETFYNDDIPIMDETASVMAMKQLFGNYFQKEEIKGAAKAVSQTRELIVLAVADSLGDLCSRDALGEGGVLVLIAQTLKQLREAIPSMIESVIAKAIEGLADESRLVTDINIAPDSFRVDPVTGLIRFTIFSTYDQSEVSRSPHHFGGSPNHDFEPVLLEKLSAKLAAEGLNLHSVLRVGGLDRMFPKDTYLCSVDM